MNAERRPVWHVNSVGVTLLWPDEGAARRWYDDLCRDAARGDMGADAYVELWAGEIDPAEIGSEEYALRIREDGAAQHGYRLLARWPSDDMDPCGPCGALTTWERDANGLSYCTGCGRAWGYDDAASSPPRG